MVEEVHGFAANPGPPPGERPFVGRKAVLEAPAAELEATLRGDTRFVPLTGPPGIGKTKLYEGGARRVLAGRRLAGCPLARTASC
jgi:hypothetical protein